MIIKKIIVYSVLLIVVGCSFHKRMVTVKYKPTKTNQYYYLDVPINYSLKEYVVTIESENQYVYGDSSFIYISNFKNTPNYYNIKSLGDSIAQYRFQNRELAYELNQLLGKAVRAPLLDTFDLSGVQKNGLFWRDLKIGQISIGYVNVPNNNMELFDEAIRSIRTSKRNTNETN